MVIVRDADRLTRNQSDGSRFEKAAVEHRVLLSAYVGGDLDVATPERGTIREADAEDARERTLLTALSRFARSVSTPVIRALRGCHGCILLPSVRPSRRPCTRVTCRRAREGGTGRHSGRSLTVTDRRRSAVGRRSSRRAPFPRSGEAGAVRLGPTAASREKEATLCLVTGQTLMRRTGKTRGPCSTPASLTQLAFMATGSARRMLPLSTHFGRMGWALPSRQEPFTGLP